MLQIPSSVYYCNQNGAYNNSHTGGSADNILMLMGSEWCVYHGDLGGAMPKFRWRREMKKLRDLIKCHTLHNNKQPATNENITHPIRIYRWGYFTIWYRSWFKMFIDVLTGIHSSLIRRRRYLTINWWGITQQINYWISCNLHGHGL